MCERVQPRGEQAARSGAAQVSERLCRVLCPHQRCADVGMHELDMPVEFADSHRQHLGLWTRWFSTGDHLDSTS
jgi:hypothetical protein